MSKMTNLFVLMKDGTVQRMVLAQDIQYEVSQMFEEQASVLLESDLDLIAFDGRLTADESQVLYIDGFQVPQAIQEAVANPLACDPFILSDSDLSRVCALFTGDTQGHAWFSFQAFDRRQLLSQRGFNLVLAGNTFKKLEEPGVSLGTSVCAHFVGGRLYFKSYHVAKRVLDLTSWYHEASDAEIAELFEQGYAHCENREAFGRVVDVWTRQKLALILKGDVLTKIPPDQLRKAASVFDVSIAYESKNGKEVIVFPCEKRALKTLLRFLDEDFFASSITETRYVTNSKYAIA